MLSKEKMDRINFLAKKAKTASLSAEEKQEQKKLREEYLHHFRKGMRQHIESLKVVDEKGRDVTPEKLKKIQKDKGIHGR